MAVNQSRARALLDVDPSVTLRSISAGAITATATEASISLNELDNTYWDDGNAIPYGQFKINVNVSAADFTSLDETYVLALLVDDVAGMSDTPRTVAQLSITAPGFYTMVVDSKNIPLLDSDTSGTDKFLAIRATLGGTTPSITYGAWMGRIAAMG